MKLMNKKMMLITLAMLTAPVAFAGNYKESACPKMAVIQTIGIDVVEREPDGKWAGRKNDNYGTKANWEFFVGPIQAESADEALKKANDALKYLKFLGESKGPPWGFCNYEGTVDGVIMEGLAVMGDHA